MRSNKKTPLSQISIIKKKAGCKKSFKFKKTKLKVIFLKTILKIILRKKKRR